MDKVFLQMFEAAAKVGNEWSLAAFAIAALVFIVYILLKRRNVRKGTERFLQAVVIAVVILGLAPHLSRVYLQNHGVYRLRITVEDPRGTPVNDATVVSSVGGEQKRVGGGWEIDIPAVDKPPDGKIKIYGELRSAFLTGRTDLVLASDYSLMTTLHLAQDRSARVLGNLVDRHGVPVSGALVTVVGYESEGVITGPLGQFALPAHASDRQEVKISALKKGLGSISEWVQAGERPVTLVLK